MLIDNAEKTKELEKNPNPEEINAEETQTQENEDEEEFEVKIKGDESEAEKNPDEDEDDLEEIIKTLPEKAKKLPSILRNTIKQKNKAIAEMEKQSLDLKMRLEQLEKQIPNQTQKDDENDDLPPKPSYEDFDYDTEAYDKALIEYHDLKKQKEEAKAKQLSKQKEEIEAITTQFNEKLKKYQEEKVKYPDIDLVEKRVTATLPIPLQNVIIDTVKNPENIVYVLGKKPELLNKLKDLNPVKFAYEIAKLEANATIQSTRKPVVPPEGKIISEKSKGILDLEEQFHSLKQKAQQTGDMTELLRFKRINPEYKGR